MTPGALAVIVVLLVVAIGAIVYAWHKGGTCFATDLWALPDGTGKTISCPAGTITVQKAIYGAPWSNCAWADVTPQVAAAVNGKYAADLPGKISVADPCPGTDKVFIGAYTCA
jgi:hypothetical protein